MPIPSSRNGTYLSLAEQFLAWNLHSAKCRMRFTIDWVVIRFSESGKLVQQLFDRVHNMLFDGHSLVVVLIGEIQEQ